MSGMCRKIKSAKILAFAAILLLRTAHAQRSSAQEQALQPPDLAQKAQELKQELQQEKVKEGIGETQVQYIAVHVLALGVRPHPKGDKDNIDAFIQVVNGLDRKEFFQLYDGGKKQEIDRVYPPEEVPIQLGVLLETDASMSGVREFYENYIKDIKKHLRPTDGFFFSAFNNALSPIQDLQPASSDSKQLLKNAYEHVDWKTKESARFRDAVAAALEKLSPPEEQKQAPVIKKILLVICSTDDAGDASATDAATLNDLAKKLGVQIFAIAVRDSRGKGTAPWSGANIAQLTGGVGYVTYLEDLESGHSHPGGPQDQMNAKAQTLRNLQDIFAALKSEILIGYYLNQEDSAPGSWINIEIQLNENLPEVRKIREHAFSDAIRLLYARQHFNTPKNSETQAIRPPQ